MSIFLAFLRCNINSTSLTLSGINVTSASRQSSMYHRHPNLASIIIFG